PPPAASARATDAARRVPPPGLTGVPSRPPAPAGPGWSDPVPDAPASARPGRGRPALGRRTRTRPRSGASRGRPPTGGLRDDDDAMVPDRRHPPRPPGVTAWLATPPRCPARAGPQRAEPDGLSVGLLRPVRAGRDRLADVPRAGLPPVPGHLGGLRR